MKKIYIIPAAKPILLDTETLLAFSGGEISDKEKEGTSSMSNHRTASSSIWGED